MAGASFAQDMPLIHSDGTSMIIRGPVARNWARIAQKAKGYPPRRLCAQAWCARSLRQPMIFGAKGSSAAIKRVLDRCG